LSFRPNNIVSAGDGLARLITAGQQNAMLTSSELPVIEVDHLLKSEYDDIRLFCRSNTFFQEFCVFWWPDEIAGFGTVDVPAAYEDVDVAVT
jgi:hypothetical protein